MDDGHDCEDIKLYGLVQQSNFLEPDYIYSLTVKRQFFEEHGVGLSDFVKVILWGPSDAIEQSDDDKNIVVNCDCQRIEALNRETQQWIILYERRKSADDAEENF
jgi:hypothetical protein